MYKQYAFVNEELSCGFELKNQAKMRLSLVKLYMKRKWQEQWDSGGKARYYYSIQNKVCEFSKY